jgi:hypothetical protein
MKLSFEMGLEFIISILVTVPFNAQIKNSPLRVPLSTSISSTVIYPPV